jgi:hypothetical protein
MEQLSPKFPFPLFPVMETMQILTMETMETMQILTMGTMPILTMESR